MLPSIQQQDTPPPFLHPLPPHLISSSILCCCDAASLSSVLTALSSSRRHRQHGFDVVSSAVRLRVGALEVGARLPPIQGGGGGGGGARRWGRVDFASLLRGCCCCRHDGEEASSSEEVVLDGDDDSSSEFERFLSRIRRLSQTFPALSFFEDEPNLQLRAEGDGGGDRTGGRRDGCTPRDDDGSQQRSSQHRDDAASSSSVRVRTELPLWVGSIPFCFLGVGARGAPKTNFATVFVTTARETWHPVLLAEWAKLNCEYDGHRWNNTGKRGKVLIPLPRRATPLPPLARVSGLSLDDRKLLSGMGSYLSQTDDVVHLRTDGMSVLIMSRRQALRRLESDPIGRSFLRRASDAENLEAWSLGYVQQASQNGSEGRWLRRAASRRDVYARNVAGEATAAVADIEDLGSYVQDDDHELFAFMDRVDDSDTENGLFDLSSTVGDMVTLMKRCPS